MKARTQGKPQVTISKTNNSTSERNMITNILNCINRLLEIMDADGNLEASNIKRILDSSYNGDIYKFTDEKSFSNAFSTFNKTRRYMLDLIDEAKSVSDYKKIFKENLEIIDLSRLVTSILAELKSLSRKSTKANYDLITEVISIYPKKDLVSINLTISKKGNQEETEEEKILRLKKEFKDRSLIPVYVSTSASEVLKNEDSLNNIWDIEELILVQKPKDIMEFAIDDEVKFKLLYLYVQYAYQTYGEYLYDHENNKWTDGLDIHRNKEGYKVESEAIKGVITPSFISTDKFLLVSGYRALECLENEDYPIPKQQLISMIIEIEKQLKDKNVCLNNKFDTNSYIRILNSNIEIVLQKLKEKQLKKQDLKDMYIQGKTSYHVLRSCVSKEELSEYISYEEVIEEYKKFKKDEKNNRFYRIAKLYRDNRIKYKTDKGDILDDELNLLKESLQEINGNEGVIEFLNMGIFDVSTIIGFDDENLIKEAFLAGAFSKSDIQTIIDFEIIKSRKLKEEVDALPDTSKKEFLMANLTDKCDNPKRKYLYSIDPEAKSINAGEGYEIFFINGFAIIVDSLSKDINSGKSTIVIGMDAFEEEFGLNGCNVSKLFNRKANGELSINKLAKQKCAERGFSFGFNHNWCDVMMQIVIGDEVERESRYDEQDLAEQRRAIKMINESLQKI